MKILVFCDSHNSDVAMRKVKAKVKKHKPNLILCCGDFTIFMQQVEEVLKEMNRFKIPTFVIHGNHEDETVLQLLCTQLKYVNFLHNKVAKINDIMIMGYGGGGFSLKDNEFKQSAMRFEKAIKECKECKKIMLIHQPPHNSGIDLVYGECAGNKTTKKFIEKNKIDYVFAGHLHENSGKECKMKKTKYINPGPWGKIVII